MAIAVQHPIHQPYPHWDRNVANRTYMAVGSVVTQIAVGMLTAGASLYISGLLSLIVDQILQRCGVSATIEQSSVAELKNAANLPPSYIKGLIISVVIIAPVLEEVIFRGALQGITKWCQGENANSTTNKVIRVVLNGTIFGLCHLSPALGWSNVPVFLVTAFGGCVSATLKEAFGGLTAPIAEHATFNGCTVLRILSRA